jgi:predicted nucleotide-binding protein
VIALPADFKLNTTSTLGFSAAEFADLPLQQQVLERAIGGTKYLARSVRELTAETRIPAEQVLEYCERSAHIAASPRLADDGHQMYGYIANLRRKYPISDSGQVQGNNLESITQDGPARGDGTVGESLHTTEVPSARATAPRDPTSVMVVHGRDLEVQRAMFDWLRSIGLRPREWSDLVSLTGVGSPFIGQVLERAFAEAQAVVVLVTPDERVALQNGLATASSESRSRFQARPNVLFEAGMAFATRPERTVLVVAGPVQLPTDLAGRHFILLDGTSAALHELSLRLEHAGCPVRREGRQWLDPSRFPARSPAVLPEPDSALDLAVSAVADHHLEAFRVTPEGRIEHSWFPNDRGEQQWEPWYDFERHEPVRGLAHPIRSVAAASADSESLALFILDADGTVWWRFWRIDTGWSAELNPLGQPFGVARNVVLAATSWRAGHIELQAVADDGSRRNIWFENGRWNPDDVAAGAWNVLPASK